MPTLPDTDQHFTAPKHIVQECPFKCLWMLQDQSEVQEHGKKKHGKMRQQQLHLGQRFTSTTPMKQLLIASSSFPLECCALALENPEWRVPPDAFSALISSLHRSFPRVLPSTGPVPAHCGTQSCVYLQFFPGEPASSQGIWLQQFLCTYPTKTPHNIFFLPFCMMNSRTRKDFCWDEAMKPFFLLLLFYISSVHAIGINCKLGVTAL